MLELIVRRTTTMNRNTENTCSFTAHLVNFFSCLRDTTGLSGRYLNRAEISLIVKPITMILVLFLAGSAVSALELSVPAEFSYELRVPGKFNQISRPSSIFYDDQVGECFVADPGNNRIVIFDQKGNYVFEIAGTNHFSSPSEVAVDRDGFVWVLSSTSFSSCLTVFDFDGLFLRTLELPREIDDQPTRFRSFDLDRDKNIYLLDRNSTRIVVMDSQGSIKTSFEILGDYNAKDRGEEVIGRLRVENDLLLVPCGTSSVVYLYSKKGNLVGGVGYKGSNVGSLSFPVSAVMAGDSLVLVLDKHRDNVVCYDISGKFRGEFGGRGISPGWFYHPTLLETNNKNQVYIGQIFNGKVQACRIPEFICPSHDPGGEMK